MRRILATLGLALVLAVGLVVPPGHAQFSSNPYAPTYSAGVVFLPGNAATDFACIEGGSSGAVRVLRVSLYVANAAATAGTMLIIKRTSLNTGGTSVANPLIPRDSSSSSSSVVLRTYTANPTALGVSAGNTETVLLSETGFIPNSPAPFVFNWTSEGQQPTLKGSAEALCFNNNASAVMNGAIIWITVVVQQG
jgi:hypothetical protein